MIICYCPQCKQRYEVAEVHAGKNVTCTACGNIFSIPIPMSSARVNYMENSVDSEVVSAVRVTGQPPARNKIYITKRNQAYSSRPAVQNNIVQINVPEVKQGGIIGAWACLILAVLLNIFTNWLFPLWGPLYFAAFVLSLVAMAQKRVGGGIIVLLLTVLLPPFIFLGNVASSMDLLFKSRQSESLSPAASTPHGKNELTGLCGMTFGERWAKATDSRDTELTNGETLHCFDPTKPFMEFTSYYALITPTSRRIYAVWLNRKFERLGIAREEFKRVDMVLEKYYGIKGVELISVDEVKRYNFNNGYILLKLTFPILDTPTLELRAHHSAFEELSEKEKKSEVIRNTDTSAL